MPAEGGPHALGGATTGTGNLNMYASTIGFMPTVGVGIGTTVPTAILSVLEANVNGDVSRKNMFLGLRKGTYAVQNSASMAFALGPNVTTINPYGSLDIKLNGAPFSGNNFGDIPDITVMSIIGNGNVGIGTTAPGYSLDVVGITRSAGIINTVPGYYIGYTTNKPIVYQSTGTNNANGTLYANSYNYVMYPSNTQSPAGFVTTTGGKYSVSYSGIYAISFTLGPSGTQTAALEPFIAKNQYGDDLNAPGTGTLASSTILTGIGQLNLCWTGYLSSGDFITTGCYMGGGGSCTLNTRTTLSITLVHRTT